MSDETVAFLRCHCETLITNDKKGKAQLQRHYREMRKMIAAPDDRNEGECYGPFHAGLVCRPCAERVRSFEIEIERLKALIKQLEDALQACIDETPAYETD